jgi:hypothetical protein
MKEQDEAGIDGRGICSPPPLPTKMKHLFGLRCFEMTGGSSTKFLVGEGYLLELRV